MADPKYAHLSGIAYDQPDVYETSDLPEADQTVDDAEEDSESIEKLSISAKHAFSRFKDKSIVAENVDFSDRLTRKRRTGYDIWSDDKELVGAGEKETPLQRYQRLQCEMRELLDDVANLKDEASKDTPAMVEGAQVESLLKELEDLRLEKSLGTEMVSHLADPEGAQLKKLMAQLEKLSGSGGKKEEEGVTKTVIAGNQGEVKYQVNAKPSQALLSQATRLAELEARVNRLSSFVATTPNTLHHLGSGERNLFDTAKWIAAKVSLMDSSQLEAADSRISSLLSKLDQLGERSAAITGTQNAERDKKIAELYELAKTMEEISQVLPRALDRMVALESLHKQGEDFAKSLNELDSVHTLLLANCESNKQSLRKVEENFAAKLVTLKSTIEGLDSRIKALAGKSNKK